MTASMSCSSISLTHSERVGAVERSCVKNVEKSGDMKEQEGLPCWLTGS